MAIKYLKKSPKTPSTDDSKTAEIVKKLLKEIEVSKEDACINLTKKFDDYDGEIVVSKEKIDKIKDRKNREAVALRDNLKRRKIFQKKIKRKKSNVY